MIDQVIWTLARRCRPDDVVIVGLATPVAAAAALVARELLHPGLTVITAGLVDPEPYDLARAQADPAYEIRAAGRLPHQEMLDGIAAGRITLQFLSPAQVDAAGRMNTSRVPGRRLPGGLATADVAVLLRRVVAYRAAHDARFLVPEVFFTTGAAGRLEAVVTGLGVIAYEHGPRLEALHPGATAEEVRERTGFALDTERAVAANPPPPEAIEFLDRVIDPYGVRRMETREGRAEATAALLALAAKPT